MHPMFVTLFLEPDDDLLASEEEKRQKANLARREPARQVMKAAARAKDRQARR